MIVSANLRTYLSDLITEGLEAAKLAAEVSCGARVILRKVSVNGEVIFSGARAVSPEFTETESLDATVATVEREESVTTSADADQMSAYTVHGGNKTLHETVTTTET